MILCIVTSLIAGEQPTENVSRSQIYSLQKPNLINLKKARREVKWDTGRPLSCSPPRGSGAHGTFTTRSRSAESQWGRGTQTTLSNPMVALALAPRVGPAAGEFPRIPLLRLNGTRRGAPSPSRTCAPHYSIRSLRSFGAIRLPGVRLDLD
jgi:hypothetical protein